MMRTRATLLFIAGLALAGCGEASQPAPTRSLTQQPTTLSAATPSPTLMPGESAPAAGICAEPLADKAVVITLTNDVPSPRCQKLLAWQRLEVKNATSSLAHVTFGTFTADIVPGGSHLFDQPFGTFFAPGVHHIEIREAGINAPELWLGQN